MSDSSNAEPVCPDEINPAPAIDVVSLPELDTLHRFEFIAAFTGRLGSLGGYRFNPMVPIVQGCRYRVSIVPETGATLVMPLEVHHG